MRQKKKWDYSKLIKSVKLTFFLYCNILTCIFFDLESNIDTKSEGVHDLESNIVTNLR